MCSKKSNSQKYLFSDFTEGAYREYLELAKQYYYFIFYSEIENKEKQCLWRHDIDFSPQRALKLAKIETDQEVKSTFFVLLHSEYYSALEKENVEIFKEIISLGHMIGLHFDIEFFGEKIKNLSDLEKYLMIEKEYLSNILDAPISAFSFHNPGFNTSLNYDQKMIAGMVNVYSKEIKEKFSYTSDSFCIWKNERLKDVLTNAIDENIQILTHPVCWSAEESSPHDRIIRSIEGRKEKTIQIYLSRSKKVGRKIIK